MRGRLDEVIAARNLDESGVGDPLGDVPASGNRHQRISRGVHHERRCRDLGQELDGIEVDDAVDLAADVGLRGRLSLQAPVPAQVQEEASALRATAMSAAEPVYVAENIVGAPPQVERWQPPQAALDRPEETAPLLGLAAPTDDGQATQPAQAPALPVTPRPRILLALRQAVATRDPGTIAAVIQAGRHEQPDWDPTDELERLGAVGRWRRWRRRPSFPRWLAQVTHLGRVRHD